MPLIKKVIFGLLLIFFFSSMTKNLMGYYRSLNFYDTYKKEYESEQKKNNELKMLATKTRDPFELKKTIRNKLNLTKPGEVMVVVPQPTVQPIEPTPTALPVYKQWAATLFKN